MPQRACVDLHAIARHVALAWGMGQPPDLASVQAFTALRPTLWQSDGQTETLTDVYAETMLILSDVIAMFELAMSTANNNVTDDRWAFEMPISTQPYSSRFDNLLTGWSCQFVLRVPNAVNLCDALYN